MGTSDYKNLRQELENITAEDLANPTTQFVIKADFPHPGLPQSSGRTYAMEVFPGTKYKGFAMPLWKVEGSTKKTKPIDELNRTIEGKNNKRAKQSRSRSPRAARNKSPSRARRAKSPNAKAQSAKAQTRELRKKCSVMSAQQLL